MHDAAVLSGFGSRLRTAGRPCNQQANCELLRTKCMPRFWTASHLYLQISLAASLVHQLWRASCVPALFSRVAANLVTSRTGTHVQGRNRMMVSLLLCNKSA